MMRRPNLTTSLVLALTLGATACSHAEDSPPAAPPAAPAEATGGRPAVIEGIEQQGLEVFGEFDAPGGLRGFAGLAGQRPMAVYVTPDGNHAVVGTLLDANGEDVGAEAMQRLVAEPVSTRVWAQLEESHWVPDGQADAPRIVYAFTDANCPFCHQFWEAARPWVEAGNVQLRHIMVGVIREDSANKAAAILSAPSPEAALTHNELAYDDGGIDGLPTVTAEIRSQLDANQRLMFELGFQGTPGILFLDESGLLQRRSGLPSPDDLPQVLGPR